MQCVYSFFVYQFLLLLKKYLCYPPIFILKTRNVESDYVEKIQPVEKEQERKED